MPLTQKALEIGYKEKQHGLMDEYYVKYKNKKKRLYGQILRHKKKTVIKSTHIERNMQLSMTRQLIKCT